jgi:biopolymer transport protein ExbB
MKLNRIFFYFFSCAATCFFLSLGVEALAADAPANGAQQDPETLLSLIGKGGVLMIPIAICSVVAVYVIIWQFLALRREQILPSDFQAKLRESLGKKGTDVKGGMAYCNQVGGPVAAIFKAGIPKIGKEETSIEKAIEDAGAREVGKMKRQLRPLSAVATIAPLLGLLGTVYGMIEAFQSTVGKETDKGTTLAQGIYEALVTTAAGLTLAIPVLICYQILIGKIDSMVDEIDNIAIDFLEHSGGSDSAAEKPAHTRSTKAKAKAKPKVATKATATA